MEAARRCPLCASDQLSVHVDAAEGDLTSTQLGSSRHEVSVGRVLRCRSCRFAFRRSRPSDDEIAALYREMDSSVYEAESAGRRRTAEIELSIVERQASTGRLLDVGCASGAFLLAASEHGWKVVGVEPAADLARRAEEVLAGRGLVVPSALQEAELPEDSFDVLTLWDVLEHVPEPAAFLLACTRLVRPGGLIFVNVPDLDSWPARLLGARWPLLLPEHLNYFDPRSLRLLSERVELEWVRSGRRWARFSAHYVLYRLGQHALPGAETLRRLLQRTPLAGLVFPVPLGEMYAVLRRPYRTGISSGGIRGSLRDVHPAADPRAHASSSGGRRAPRSASG